MQFVSIVGDMRDKTPLRVRAIIVISTACTLLVNLSMGVFGYLSFCSFTESNILGTLHADSPIRTINWGRIMTLP